MAKVIVLPDIRSFEQALEFSNSRGVAVDVLKPPDFCSGLVPAALLSAGRPGPGMDEQRWEGLAVAGIIEYRPSGRQTPAGGAPDPAWRTVIGSLFIERVRVSVSDPNRFRFDIRTENDLGPLIPIMARFIRGGSFRPDVPCLAFGEERRLIALSGHSIVISRAGDLPDMWVMLRTAVDLILGAWYRKEEFPPDLEPRKGLGAIEIFRRLPGTDCGLCGRSDCMEFSHGLLLGKGGLSECPVLSEAEYAKNLKSLTWLMDAI